ncbi:MAG: hypothetical protein JWO98_1255 [Frankiales bacterium]|nr:hypothetical protein [Frankiales bacterium]
MAELLALRRYATPRGRGITSINSVDGMAPAVVAVHASPPGGGPGAEEAQNPAQGNQNATLAQ